MENFRDLYYTFSSLFKMGPFQLNFSSHGNKMIHNKNNIETVNMSKIKTLPLKAGFSYFGNTLVLD